MGTRTPVLAPVVDHCNWYCLSINLLVFQSIDLNSCLTSNELKRYPLDVMIHSQT